MCPCYHRSSPANTLIDNPDPYSLALHHEKKAGLSSLIPEQDRVYRGWVVKGTRQALGPVPDVTAAASDFLQCPLFPAPGPMQKAATTAQQPCFSTKFALCQKPLTQNEKKKKFVCFFYFSPFGHRFHPCPPSAGTACSHVPPPSTAKCAGSQQANTKVTEEGTGQKTIQAGRELRLQKNLTAAKKNRDWPFLEVCPAPIPCQHLLSSSQSRGWAPRLQSSLFFQWFLCSETQFKIPNGLPVRKGAREICSQLHFIWVPHKPPQGSLSCYSNANRLLWFFFTSKISPLQ